MVGLRVSHIPKQPTQPTTNKCYHFSHPLAIKWSPLGSERASRVKALSQGKYTVKIKPAFYRTAKKSLKAFNWGKVGHKRIHKDPFF